MALAAIAGIGNLASFIPQLPRLQQITPQQGFEQVARNALTGPTLDPRTLTAAADRAQALAALEQEFFDNWLATLQGLQAGPVGSSSFDPLLSSQLGPTALVGTGTPESPFGLTTGVTPGLASGIAGLFDTLQLMGAQPNRTPQQLGQLIDLLA